MSCWVPASAGPNLLSRRAEPRPPATCVASSWARMIAAKSCQLPQLAFGGSRGLVRSAVNGAARLQSEISHWNILQECDSCMQGLWHLQGIVIDPSREDPWIDLQEVFSPSRWQILSTIYFFHIPWAAPRAAKAISLFCLKNQPSSKHS